MLIVENLAGHVRPQDIAGKDADSLVLTSEQRRWVRGQFTTSKGRQIALALPTGTSLEPGVIVCVQPEWYLAIEAAPEPVLAIFPSDYAAAVKLAFEVVLKTPVRIGLHGIALYNCDRNLVWGTAVNSLDLSAGRHTFVHALPSLPLRPGPYSWRVSLWDEHGLVDDWQCVPEMLVATEPLTHPNDEWAGVLNIPAVFSVLAGSDAME